MDLQTCFRPETQIVKGTQALPAKSGLRVTSTPVVSSTPVLSAMGQHATSFSTTDINYGISEEYDVITSDVDDDIVNAIDDFDYDFDLETEEDYICDRGLIDSSVPANLELEQLLGSNEDKNTG